MGGGKHFDGDYGPGGHLQRQGAHLEGRRLDRRPAEFQFELLEHPADIGFRTFGNTPAELFGNAAMAMLSIAAVLDQTEPRQEYELSAEGSDYESLLVAWLSEVLYLYDGRGVAVNQFRVHAITPQAIAATALGEPRDPKRHPALLDVKAVTWHQLKVEETPAGWVAQVYLDI